MNLRREMNSYRPTALKMVFCTVLLLSLAWSDSVAQYLHRSGKVILDGDNNEIILRGMGLGGWMLQEGYMLETNAFANPQHEIRAKIEELIGAANTDAFYDKWLTNFITRRDIDSLAKWGFNSVRLPMHYNLYTLPIEDEPVAGQHTWLDRGFALTDSLVKWCAANNMYVILDLHAAPGGQGRDAAISDYDDSKPSLWESEANKAKTVALWRKLAERYKNEKWIGGYDLINETNWNFTAGAHPNGCAESTNAPLKKLFTDITAAIREVDNNHIIFIEGNCWANNHAGLFPAWDNNMAISFHKYWSINDLGSIQGLINLRNQYNLPLWMGEAGENSNVWFRGAIELLERNKIGWAWWPLKKVGSIVNPLTIVKNDGYNTLLGYWANGGTKPTVDFAKNAMMQLAENVKIENTIFRPDVIDAMFRQVNDKTTRPFKTNHVPGTVYASDFDLGPLHKAYYDTDTATQHVSTGGSFTSWNNGWTYRNDAVDLESNADTDPASNKMNVGWTADNEWIQYTVHADSSAAYSLTLRYAISGTIKISVDGVDQSPVTVLPAGTGWKNAVIDDVLLHKGERKVRLHFVKGGANVGFMKFALSKKMAEAPFKATTAQTTPDGAAILVSINKPVDGNTLTSADGFTLTSDGNEIELSDISVTSDHTIRLGVAGDLNDGEQLLLSYNGSAILSTDGSTLEGFNELVVSNNLPLHISLPGQLEAEAFEVNQGLQLENTSDAGGGQNIGYTNTGDYLDYRIKVTQGGEFSLDLRVASAGQAGILEIQQMDGDKSVIHSTTVNIPVTGGWQTWQTIKASMTLDAGRGWLRLKIVQPEFNLNWIKFTNPLINSIEKTGRGSLYFYPNPAEGFINIEAPDDFKNHPDSFVAIHNLTGQMVRRFDRLDVQSSPALYVGDLFSGLYTIHLYSRGRMWANTMVKH